MEAKQESMPKRIVKVLSLYDKPISKSILMEDLHLDINNKKERGNVNSAIQQLKSKNKLDVSIINNTLVYKLSHRKITNDTNIADFNRLNYNELKKLKERILNKICDLKCPVKFDDITICTNFCSSFKKISIKDILYEGNRNS